MQRGNLLSLSILCTGSLMVSLDGSIVTIALTAIKDSLLVSDTALVWVVNAYMLPFGACMLLAGRLGDLYGPRQIFLFGTAAFTVASLCCGLSGSWWSLIAGRAIQGMAAAVVYVLALSMSLNLFSDEADRAKAVGVFGFVSMAGGSLALLLGGALTAALSWHWIFLINIPIGAAVCISGLRLLPVDSSRSKGTRLGVPSALTLTVSLVIALYGISLQGSDASAYIRRAVFIAASGALMAIFVRIEGRARTPLVPIAIFRNRELMIATAIDTAATAAMLAWGFITSLYLQRVLNYTPFQAGLAFLPANLTAAILALAFASAIVARLGKRLPLVLGLITLGAGFALFCGAPVGGKFASGVLPGMLLVGIGLGVVPLPLTLFAMDEVDPNTSGVASGFLNTASLIGGALGLAVLVSVGSPQTAEVLSLSAAHSLNEGYHSVFLASALCTLAAAFGAAVLLRDRQRDSSLKLGRNVTSPAPPRRHENP